MYPLRPLLSWGPCLYHRERRVCVLRLIRWHRTQRQALWPHQTCPRTTFLRLYVSCRSFKPYYRIPPKHRRCRCCEQCFPHLCHMRMKQECRTSCMPCSSRLMMTRCVPRKRRLMRMPALLYRHQRLRLSNPLLWITKIPYGPIIKICIPMRTTPSPPSHLVLTIWCPSMMTNSSNLVSSQSQPLLNPNQVLTRSCLRKRPRHLRNLPRKRRQVRCPRARRQAALRPGPLPPTSHPTRQNPTCAKFLRPNSASTRLVKPENVRTTQQCWPRPWLRCMYQGRTRQPSHRARHVRAAAVHGACLSRCRPSRFRKFSRRRARAQPVKRLPRPRAHRPTATL